MPSEPDIASVAALIGDPARAAMLTALMDGRSLPAGELAYVARVTPQTASSHLARLVAGGLVVMTASGRHRYYMLRSPEVAQALEALTSIAAQGKARSLREVTKVEALRKARLCYDHLAGSLGVAVTGVMAERGWLEIGPECCEVTHQGMVWLAACWGISVPDLRKKRRSLARPCVDWSERRLHLGGAVGAALADALFEAGWIARRPEDRGVTVTEAGRDGFNKEFGIVLE